MKRFKAVLLFVLLLIKNGIFFKTFFVGIDDVFWSHNWFYYFSKLSPFRFTIVMSVEKLFKGDIHKWSVFDNDWMKLLDKYGID